MGIFLSLVPRIEALASPVCRNEQRRSPRRYVYDDKLQESQWRLSATCLSDITYPWASLLLWCLTTVFGTARFLCVKHKASSNAFPKNTFILNFRPWASASLWNCCKDSKKMEMWFNIHNKMIRKNNTWWIRVRWSLLFLC